ncbi:glycosyltransferase family 4 protein [Bacillus sp. JJ1566]|uniref:glycosyltransferase family 4 protein n=1 Tax=Bacillus sp. JJ1566 TaxID=3122961 RepID=UPI002FFDDD42
MKFLIATYFLLPQAGGVGTHIEAVKQELERNGHTVDVLGQSPNLKELYIINSGQSISKSIINPIHPLRIREYYKNHFPHLDSWIIQKELSRYTFELTAALFDLSKYDVILTQDVISTRIFRRIKPKHIPIICTIHGQMTKELVNLGIIKSDDTDRWHYQMAEELNGLLSADKIIVPTEWMKSEIQNNFDIPSDIYVIPYCARNIPSFLEKLEAEPYPPVPTTKNKIIIGCISRLVSYKGHPILFDALKKLKKRREDFECWIVGDGPDKEYFQEYSEKKGLKNFIKFLGSRNDVPSLLQKMDIVVLPTLQDNMPFSIIEAQIAGKAICASETGGIPEMIDSGYNGFLFQKNNSKQLSEQLLTLIQNDKIRKTLEANTQQMALKQWDPELLYDRLKNVYDELLIEEPLKPNVMVDHLLLEKYGISIKSKQPIENLKDIFLFDTLGSFEETICLKIMEHIPDTYCLPDLQMLKTIVEITMKGEKLNE